MADKLTVTAVNRRFAGKMLEPMRLCEAAEVAEVADGSWSWSESLQWPG